ncbi:MAG: Abi family protein [Moraxella sp.]|nr:Abi family protein [Moraxella sp.]
MTKSSLNLENIERSLSIARLSTYRKLTNSLDAALALYGYNTRLTKEFFLCIQVCEVVVRNAVSEAIVKVHGNDWAWQSGFFATLPNPNKGYNSRENIAKARHNQKDINNVIPELNFVFWQLMFTSRHDKQLWIPHIQNVFPNADDVDKKELRESLHNDLNQIRRLRNRIAHHEPIFNENLVNIYEKIIKIIAYRCHDTANWLQTHQEVTTLLTDKPTLTHKPLRRTHDKPQTHPN